MKTKTIRIHVPQMDDGMSVAIACTAMFVQAMKDIGIMDEYIGACLIVAASKMGFIDADEFKDTVGPVQ